ncbi:MAG TPA: hypothetical protein VLX32_03420 [Candidatus Acidoferrum sp.]|nr:hypothetical protein [Candidatus Acidoferrum sp.]
MKHKPEEQERRLGGADGRTEKSNTKDVVEKKRNHKEWGHERLHGENPQEFRRKSGVRTVAAGEKIKKVQKYS